MGRDACSPVVCCADVLVSPRADGGFGTLSLPEKTFRSCKQQPGQAQLLAVFPVWELGAAVPSVVCSPGAVDSFQLCLRVYFVLPVPAVKRAPGKIPAGRSGGGSVHTHRHWAASAGGEGLCSDQCPHGPAGCWRCAVLQDQPRCCTQGIPAGGSRVLRVPWAGHSSARARRVRGKGAVARGV